MQPVVLVHQRVGMIIQKLALAADVFYLLCRHLLWIHVIQCMSIVSIVCCALLDIELLPVVEGQ